MSNLDKNIVNAINKKNIMIFSIILIIIIWFFIFRDDNSNIENKYKDSISISLNNKSKNDNFPLCETPDIKLWNWQIWASCNINIDNKNLFVFWWDKEYEEQFLDMKNINYSGYLKRIEDIINYTWWKNLDSFWNDDETSNNIRKWLCPQWWHIPSINDVIDAYNFLSNENYSQQAFSNNSINFVKTLNLESGSYWTSSYNNSFKSWYAYDIKSFISDDEKMQLLNHWSMKIYINDLNKENFIRCIKK